MAQKKAQKKVAVFDVDGTIFRSSLLIELLNQLIRNDIFPKNTREMYKDAYRAWLDRKGSYEDYIMSVVKAFEKNIKGVPYPVLEAYAHEVAEVHADEVYKFTRDLVKDLKKKGYYLLAISGSPKIVAEEFCKNLKFDKVYGRMFEISGVSDSFTGKILDEELISNKKEILKRAVEKENLTLTGSIGVGDTETDISFLNIVSKPICFNPNEKLYKHGKRKGWKIVVERKDVIYKL